MTIDEVKGCWTRTEEEIEKGKDQIQFYLFIYFLKYTFFLLRLQKNKTYPTFFSFF